MRILALGVAAIMALLAACTPPNQAPQPTALPDVEDIQGTVDITFPQSGAIIYAETLYLTGTADNLPDEGFRLQVITDNDETLMETVVTPPDERDNWTTEVAHEYDGDPIQAQVLALPADSDITIEYDRETIVISSQDNRPEGVFGSVTLPTDDATVGGDVIPVSGTASGLFENTLIVTLTASDGTQLDEEILTITNPYFIDEVNWSTELNTDDYTGPATVRAYYISAQDGEEITLDEVDVMLSMAAG